jgi:hypothetical protein
MQLLCPAPVGGNPIRSKQLKGLGVKTLDLLTTIRFVTSALMQFASCVPHCLAMVTTDVGLPPQKARSTWTNAGSLALTARNEMKWNDFQHSLKYLSPQPTHWPHSRFCTKHSYRAVNCIYTCFSAFTLECNDAAANEEVIYQRITLIRWNETVMAYFNVRFEEMGKRLA